MKTGENPSPKLLCSSRLPGSLPQCFVSVLGFNPLNTEHISFVNFCNNISMLSFELTSILVIFMVVNCSAYIGF